MLFPERKKIEAPNKTALSACNSKPLKGRMLRVADTPNIERTKGNKPTKQPGHPFAKAAAKIPIPLVIELFLSAANSFNL